MSRTFQQLKESQYAGDYLVNKKASLLYCKNNKCNNVGKCKTHWNEGDYLLNKKARDSVLLGTIFNKKELYAGLITQENLKGVPVIQDAATLKSPTPIDVADSSSGPFYQTYTIDPDGFLFGNTVCGVNNFVQFMEPMK